MGEEKKKSNASDAFYYIGITLAAAAFCFFGYMKLADIEIFIFNRIIGCYTICFTAVVVFLLIRIYTLYSKTKHVNYQVVLMSIACFVGALCFINSIAEDFSKSKRKDKITVNETTMVYLCERVEKSGHTKIDVYRVRDRLVKKIGEIDEKPFSVRCVAEGAYDYFVGDNGDVITINCKYGKYYDERVALKSEYDKGYLSYTFALE